MSVETAMFVRLTNGSNGLSFVFHSTAWCVTSMLRFAFIRRGDWVDQRYAGTDFNNSVLAEIFFA
jgi:hypothetical protein